MGYVISFKKSLFIIGIVIVVLWFASNLALYLYIKKQSNKNIDCVPQKIRLMESKIQAEPIYFRNIALKLPFERAYIEKIIPRFYAEQLDGISIILNKDAQIASVTFGVLPDNFMVPPNNFLGTPSESFFTSKQKSNYFRLKDYSWWNVRSNIKLGYALAIKNLALPDYDNLKIHDVETPSLRLFCYEGTANNAQIYSECNFEYNKVITYNFIIIGHNIDFLNQVRGEIMASLQLISDSDRERVILQANESFINKLKSKYPEELLLISLISVEGPREKYIEELIKIMEKKHYEKKYIDELHDLKTSVE